MTSDALKLYAGKAAAEIERRGWLRGEYAQTEVPNPEWKEKEYYAQFHEGGAKYDVPDLVEIPIEDCKVCLLGGLAAAFLGDPRKGGRGDGNGYDNLVVELADHIRPGWQDETMESYMTGEKINKWKPAYQTDDSPAELLAFGARGVVTSWNDEEADGVEEVLAKLHSIAE